MLTEVRLAELIFLGTGSGAPGGRRLPTTLAIKAGGGLYLLDCGSPAANLLAAAGEPFDDTLEALFLSHLHTDHAGGVPLLLQDLLLAGRVRPFPTLAPPRSAERLRTAARALLVEPERYPFAWRLEEAMPLQTYEFRDLAVSFIPNEHLAEHMGPEPPQSCSLFLNVQGTALLYSGDVASPEELGSHARMSGLLLHELGHHDPEDVLDFAARYNVPRLALVHIRPQWEGREAELRALARQRYRGELIIPRDGERITL